MSPHQIVVGIDGSWAAWRALDWAADEAASTGRALLVMHAGDTNPADGHVDGRPLGAALLGDAVTRLAARQPALAVDAELHDGNPADLLIEMSHAADLLAIGRARHTLPGFGLGSVAHRVLAHAHCPTAVLGTHQQSPENRIVVGVSDSFGGAAALRFAAAEAVQRGAELVAVRAWSPREWQLDAAAALPMSSPELWERQERTVLEDCVRAVRDRYPELRMRTVLSCAPTEITLERESGNAVLLALGCRRADDSRFPRLGPISSWAAHHFDCPVVVVGNPAVSLAST